MSEQTIEIINVAINASTQGRSSITHILTLNNYKSIEKIWCEAELVPPTGIPSIGWGLDRFIVNGQSINTYNNLYTLVPVVDSKTNSGGAPIKLGENNTFTVSWNAPLGAGVISPHAKITFKIKIKGVKKLPIDSEIIENLNPINIQEDINLFLEKATLPTIAIGIIIVILVIVLIISLPRIIIAKKVSENII